MYFEKSLGLAAVFKRVDGSMFNFSNISASMTLKVYN